VISIEVRQFFGHIFNLQTPVGYFTIEGGLFTGNTIHAHAEGQLDAFDRLGIKDLGIQAEWSTAGDERVCPLCQGYEGKIMPISEARGMIPLHPNCVLGDSVVESFDAIAMTRVKYFGRIIHITTAGNRHLSVTENHILLTSSGWRFAKDLQGGDELLEAASADNTLVKDPNENDGVSTISDVFESLSKILPKHIRRVSGTRPEYFHGDGSFVDQEIDVILSDCELRDEVDFPELAEIKKFFFIGGHIGSRKSLFLDGQGPLSLLFERLAAAADGCLSRQSVPAVLARCPLRGHELISAGWSTNLHSCKDESSRDDVSAASKFMSQLVEAFPAGVLFDKVINIKVEEPARGGVFVFDVFSHSSIYNLNGVLSSNCRCTWIPSEVKVPKR
jgi:hypothetical protein